MTTRANYLFYHEKNVLLLLFFLLHVSIAFPQPPPPPDFNCFSHYSTYTLSTVYRAHLDPTCTFHLPFVTAQLHLSGVPNLGNGLRSYQATKLGPCAKHPAYCQDHHVGNMCLCVMRCDGEFKTWSMYSQANMFPRGAISVNQMSHHSPLKGKTIIFESPCTSAYKVAFGPRGP